MPLRKFSTFPTHPKTPPAPHSPVQEGRKILPPRGIENSQAFRVRLAFSFFFRRTYPDSTEPNRTQPDLLKPKYFFSYKEQSPRSPIQKLHSLILDVLFSPNQPKPHPPCATGVWSLDLRMFLGFGASRLCAWD